MTRKGVPQINMEEDEIIVGFERRKSVARRDI
jgi:hypothetical protein